ncbi:MAG TPA: hypothetical protein VNK43_07130 [Gemmatimonadales bacterium]|nr:hypothetical protein [Gemmatimonadales bacterium]
MSLLSVLVIGALLGAIGGAAVLVRGKFPDRTELFLAVTLKGMLVALLTAHTLVPDSTWSHGLGLGALYGLASGVMLFLARGGTRREDRLRLFPESIVTGAIIGVLLVVYTPGPG